MLYITPPEQQFDEGQARMYVYCGGCDEENEVVVILVSFSVEKLNTLYLIRCSKKQKITHPSLTYTICAMIIGDIEEVVGHGSIHLMCDYVNLIVKSVRLSKQMSSHILTHQDVYGDAVQLY
jgi:hypothetical protein